MKSIAICLLVSCLGFCAQANGQGGVITTVAGNGIGGYAGDGGLATSAQLNHAGGVAVDASGNVFIADTNNHRIRKVSASGIITTVAGNGTPGFSGDGGPATSASLNGPNGVAVDVSGNLFIADFNNNRIREVSASGIMTTVAGNGTPGFSGDGGPATSASLQSTVGVAVDVFGNLFIAADNRIRKVSAAGTIATVAGGGTAVPGDGLPATSVLFQGAYAVAVDAFGNLFVADSFRIRKVSASGTSTTVAGSGVAGFSGDGGPATSAELNLANGVAVDASGNLFIADFNNNRIRKVSANGIITTVAGNGVLGFSGDGGPATSARLFGPTGVAVDVSGNLFIADFNNDRIREVSALASTTGNPASQAVTFSTLSNVTLGVAPFTLSATASSGLLVTFTSTTPSVCTVSGSIVTIVAVGTCSITASQAGNTAYAAAPAVTQSFTIAAATSGGNTVIYSNFGPGMTFDKNVSDGWTINGFVNANVGQQAISEQFTPGGDYTFVAAKVAVSLSGGPDSIDVFLQTDSNGRPGAVVEKIPLSGLGPAPAILTANSALFPALQHGTPYWLTLVAGAAGVNADWAWNSIGDASNSAAFTGTQGGSPAGPWPNPNSGPVSVRGAFEIDGTAGHGSQAQQVIAFSPLSNVPLGVAPFTLSATASSGLPVTFTSATPSVCTVSGSTVTVAAAGTCSITASQVGSASFAAAAQLTQSFVVSSAVQPAFSASPSSLNFQASAGASPPAQSIQLSGTAGTAWQAKASTSSGGSWLSLSPANGTILGSLTVTVNSSNLTAGTYQGSITIQAPGATPSSAAIGVTLAVSAATGGQVNTGIGATAIISTIAGNGTQGFSGDGGPGTSAALSGPQGVAVDSSGNVYIVEETNDRIRKVSPGGIITTFAGGGAGPCGSAPATSVSLGLPAGVAVDAAGNVFIADRGNYRLCKVSASGLITSVAGTGTYGFSGDGGQAAAASLAAPIGIAVDASGNLFIADADNNRIRKVSAGGIITTVAGNGTAAFSGDGGMATSASLSGPSGVAVDASGNLFIADTFNRRVRKVSTDGNITTIAGNGTFQLGYEGDGGLASAALVGVPFGLALDASGNLYIGDGGESRVRKISAGGIITTVAGTGNAGFSGDGGPAILASLNDPHGVAVDAAGNLFIAEYADNRVRKVSPPAPVDTTENLTFTGTATCTVAYCNNFGTGPVTGTYTLDVNAQAIIGPWTFSTPFGVISSSAPGATAYVSSGNSLIGVVFQINTSTFAEFIKFDFSASNMQQIGTILAGPGSNACTNIPGGQNGSPACAGGYLITGTTTLSVPPGVPFINPGGVVPLFSTANTIQPGEWVSIYGVNLAASTVSWNADFPISLGGTSVTIDGEPAYLSFVSPGQINVQVPNDSSTGLVTVAVTTANGTASATATLAPFAPSFLLVDSKHVAGIIPRSDGSGAYGGGSYDVLGPTGNSLGYPTVAAKPGDVVALFAVGLGPTNPVVRAGQLFSGAAPAINPVNVLIDNSSIAPSFAGLSEAGLDQINLTIPPGLGTGDFSLLATVGGAQTQSGVVISLQAGAVSATPQIQSLTLSPNTVASGGTVTAAVVLSGAAPPGGAIIALSTSSSVASVPATITVPAGATSATFTVSAGSVSSSQTVTVTASYGGQSTEATLSVAAGTVSNGNCQVVSQGPYSFRVVNTLSTDVLVYFGDVILPDGTHGSVSFGAQMHSNECDIVGLPQIATYSVAVNRYPNGTVVNNSLTFADTTSGFIFNGRSAYTLRITQGSCSATADQGITYLGQSVYSMCLP